VDEAQNAVAEVTAALEVQLAAVTAAEAVSYLYYLSNFYCYYFY
jgi:hypothetical protein